MNNKKLGRMTGIAFIIATAAGIASISFINIINEPNLLASIYDNPNKLIIGAMLMIIMGLACAAISYAIYPVLSKYHKGLAIGAVGFRTIEGTLFLASAAALFALLPLSQEYAAANADAALSMQVVGKMISSLPDALANPAGLAFTTGALLYNIGFYKTKLLPRWLSVWGIIAAVLHILQISLSIFGMDDFALASIIMNVPIALQELVMAVWLIIFGFREISKSKLA